MTMWHGFKGDKRWPNPKLVASSNESNRADQGNHIKANEYLDTPEVLLAKVKMMAQMVRQAKLCCAYTGAGLSRSSGIPDYATKASNSVVNNNNVPKLKSNLDALPTYAHCALTAMERAGFLHHYVQQNHDGLPQKSGFPQHKMNEIHGAWYDPSNPVVQFSGNLRGDLFKWMTSIEQEIDLCLCLGTSLSGMNADRVAETPAKKSLSDSSILGTIIINIQQTRLDDVSSLRIWGKLDEVFSLLGKELSLGEIKPQFKFLAPNERVFHVPYDANGKYNPNCDMILDLGNNKEVYIPVKGACNKMAKGIVVGMKDSNYGFSIQLEESGKFVRRILGVWWVQEAIEGKLTQLPLINVNAVVNKCAPKNSADTEMELDLTTLPPPPKQIRIVQGHGRVQTTGTNEHKWDLKIDAQDCQMVEKVIWHLHPTFHPASVSCSEAPFTISRLGWGTFVVRADVTLTKEYGAQELHAEHELSFNGGGHNVKTTLINV